MLKRVVRMITIFLERITIHSRRLKGKLTVFQRQRFQIL